MENRRLLWSSSCAPEPDGLWSPTAQSTELSRNANGYHGSSRKDSAPSETAGLIPLQRPRVPAPHWRVGSQGGGTPGASPVPRRKLPGQSCAPSVCKWPRSGGPPPGSPSACGAPGTCRRGPCTGGAAGKPRRSPAATELPPQSAKTSDSDSDGDDDRDSVTTEHMASPSAGRPDTPHGSCGPASSVLRRRAVPAGAPPGPGVCCAGLGKGTRPTRPRGAQGCPPQPRVHLCGARCWAQAACQVR